MGEQPGLDPVPVWVLWSEVDGDARLAARSLAVRSAAGLLGVGPSEVWVSHAASGRPLLDGAGRGTRVSVSHGRGAVAVALCRSPRVDLGVDVEPVRPLAALAVARGYLAPAEADWLGGLAAAERDRAFLWLWTQKEAVGKALGLGLRSGGMSRPMPLPTAWPPPGDGGVALPTGWPPSDDGHRPSPAEGPPSDDCRTPPPTEGPPSIAGRVQPSTEWPPSAVGHATPVPPPGVGLAPSSAKKPTSIDGHRPPPAEGAPSNDGLLRPPTVWPPSAVGLVTPVPLPGDPATSSAAVFVSDGRRVVGVAVRGADGLPERVSVRVAHCAADAG